MLRWVALAATVVAGAAVLVACDKPLPDVTFQSGTRSVLVSPGQYCFDAGSRASCHTAGDPTRTLQAVGGSDINISVPRSVAQNAWIVSATTTDQNGQARALDGVGSGLVVDNHSVRVPVPTAQADDTTYLLTVTEYRDNTPTGVWNLQVAVDVS